MWSLWFVGVTIPWVELIAGALVVLGLRLREALIALGFVLAIVTFGHLLREPLYDLTGHVIPRLALLLFVLWCPREHDRFSVDYLIGGRKSEPIWSGAFTGRQFTSYSTSTTTRTTLRSGVASSRLSTLNQPWEAFRNLPRVVCESRENCSAAIRAFFVAS
jgi:hypothetical protein